VLGVRLGRNDEENHEVVKGPMAGQRRTKFHEVDLYVVKWNCGELMYNCVKKVILKEFSYNLKCDWNIIVLRI
jgi:hypothetical protein